MNQPATPAAPPKRTQGMNWIPQHKRLAIYLRDGLACTYCCAAVEQGTQLSLDHLTPYSLGGSNKETNLVTCCTKCNSSRGNRDVAVFVAAVAAYTQQDEADIMQRIRTNVSGVLPLARAKEMVEQRGSCAKALAVIY